jgi:hypothetical protein
MKRVYQVTQVNGDPIRLEVKIGTVGGVSETEL